MKLLLVFSVLLIFVTVNSSANFIDEFLPKVKDLITISPNKNRIVESRSVTLEENVENFIKTHDVTIKIPIVDSTVTLDAKNIDNEEIDIKLKYNGEDGVEEARKSKLKKIFIPIFVFILIKAMVLIPLALGILAIKTWNALQLSFVSFVIALAMGVWSLCKKVSGDHVHPHVIAHNPWDTKRSFENNDTNTESNDAQNLAYSAYINKN